MAACTSAISIKQAHGLLVRASDIAASGVITSSQRHLLLPWCCQLSPGAFVRGGGKLLESSCCVHIGRPIALCLGTHARMLSLLILLPVLRVLDGLFFSVLEAFCLVLGHQRQR